MILRTNRGALVLGRAVVQDNEAEVGGGIANDGVRS